MIDIEGLYTEIRSLVIDRVGTELSTINGNPAVIQARSGGSKPNYPYVTMDILNILDNNADITNKRLLEDGTVSYQTHKDIPVVFQVRALDGDSYRLSNDLRRCFNFESYQKQFYEASGATIKEVSGIDPVPDPLSTKYTEFCTFTVTFTVNDTEVDDQLGYITFVETPTNP